MIEALERHHGGSLYFDHLDSKFRHPRFFELLTEKVYRSFGRIPNVVVTGAFGVAYEEWAQFGWREYPVFDRGGSEVLTLPGNLRHYPEWAEDAVRDRNLRPHYIFLDDSLYKGRTFTAVARALSARGSWVTSAYVLYDGSPGPLEPAVHGIYVYRKHHTVKGQ